VKMVIDNVHKFAETRVKSEEWAKKGEMPLDVIKEMSAMGMMGLAVPEEFGGLGMPSSGYARLMQELAAVDSSLGLTLGAHQSIGYKALLLFGSDEQKKKYLPKLASGEMIAAYCLTEPGSGSDAASIQTKAELSPDGQTYILNGNKLWITNGGIAQFLTVFAKTTVQEGGVAKDKVTCFIVEANSQGVSVGPPEHKLGIRASWTNAIHFENVKVPSSNIIGGVGQGFRVAMNVLNNGRLGLAGGSVGLAKKCIKASIEHANERVQFKKKIGEFGMIKEKIGRMIANCYVAESMVFMTTGLIDRKDCDYSLESSAAKIFATEMVWESADETIQIYGGSGFMEEYPFQRWMRDCRINRIFEGTNEILRAFIALSGMQGPGQELSGLADAINHPLKGLGVVGDYAIRKVKQNVFGPTLVNVDPHLKKYAAILEENVVEFASQVEVLLRRHGKQIHLMQLAQKRIADVAIDFFAIAALLSRVTQSIKDKGVENCELEISICETFCMRAQQRIQSNFRRMDRNDDDTIKLIAGKAYELGKYPFDSLDHVFSTNGK